MPYTMKQEHLLQAIAHGFKPDKAMSNVSKAKAAEMLTHGAKKKKSASRALSER